MPGPNDGRFILFWFRFESHLHHVSGIHFLFLLPLSSRNYESFIYYLEKIPCYGEFTQRSDPWAGLIASCGSFYPMVHNFLGIQSPVWLLPSRLNGLTPRAQKQAERESERTILWMHFLVLLLLHRSIVSVSTLQELIFWNSFFFGTTRDSLRL